MVPLPTHNIRVGFLAFPTPIFHRAGNRASNRDRITSCCHSRFYKTPQKLTITSSHDITWAHMTSHELTWHHTSSHDITWAHMTSHDYHMTYLIIVVPLLVATKGVAIEDLYMGPYTWRGHIETQIFLELQLTQVSIAKLLREKSMRNTQHYSMQNLQEHVLWNTLLTFQHGGCFVTPFCGSSHAHMTCKSHTTLILSWEVWPEVHWDWPEPWHTWFPAWPWQLKRPTSPPSRWPIVSRHKLLPVIRSWGEKGHAPH